MGDVLAIRNPKRGKAHRFDPEAGQLSRTSWTACTRRAEAMTEVVGLTQTAPEDRCQRCWPNPKDHPMTDTPTPAQDETEFAELLTRIHGLLHEVYLPAGVLLYVSAKNRYLDGRTLAEAIRDRDVEGVTLVANRLDALADGVFS